MNVGVDMVVNNIGLSFESTLTLCFVLAAMIFFATDFKVGLIILLLTNAGLFMIFYNFGLNWVLPLVCMFIVFIIMSLSFYMTHKAQTRGAFI